MEKVRQAIANQFVSHTKRDFVDVAQGKQVLPLSLGMGLGTATVVANGTEVVFLLHELPS